MLWCHINNCESSLSEHYCRDSESEFSPGLNQNSTTICLGFLPRPWPNVEGRHCLLFVYYSSSVQWIDAKNGNDSTVLVEAVVQEICVVAPMNRYLNCSGLLYSCILAKYAFPSKVQIHRHPQITIYILKVGVSEFVKVWNCCRN